MERGCEDVIKFPDDFFSLRTDHEPSPCELWKMSSVNQDGSIEYENYSPSLSRYSPVLKRDSRRLSPRAGTRSDFSRKGSPSPGFIQFSALRSRNNPHSILNGFDQSIRPGRRDGEGSLPVARFRLLRFIKSCPAEQISLGKDRARNPEEPRQPSLQFAGSRIDIQGQLRMEARIRRRYLSTHPIL